MQYVQAGTDLLYTFTFMKGQEIVVPDSASVFLRLYGNDDNMIDPYDPKAVTTTGSQTKIDITLEAAVNGKTWDTEFRRLEISYKVGGSDFLAVFPYMIVDRAKFPLSPADVRQEMGLSETELEDDKVDFVEAYLSVQEDIPEVDTELLFETGDTKLRALLKAIKLKACLHILPSLPLRAVQKEQADNVTYSRFAKIDWEKLEKSLTEKYLKVISEVLPSVGVTGTTVFVTASGTDPITGA